MTAYFLSEDDQKLLAEMVAEYKRRSPTPKEQSEPHDLTAPDAYVVAPPLSGIPPVTITPPGQLDIPGSASCNLFRVWLNSNGDFYELKPVTPHKVTVFNVGEGWVTSTYKIVWKDKFGRWVTEAAGADTGTGTSSAPTGTATASVPPTGTATATATGTATATVPPTGTATATASVPPTGTGTGSVPPTGTGTATGTGTVVPGTGTGNCEKVVSDLTFDDQTCELTVYYTWVAKCNE